MIPTRPNLLLLSLLAASLSLYAQPATQAGAPPAQGTGASSAAPTSATRLIGTVTASSEDSLTLQLEKGGGEAVVALGPQTKMVRTAPGQTTLAGATVIHASDLSTGDRVLVRAMPGADSTHYSASILIAMKQADIAQARASQSEDWQRRGVGGIVKTVDATASGVIVVSTAQPGRTLTIHLSQATTIRRYAPDSVNFADAKPSTLGEIHPGDQLRARGDKSPDGTDVAAVEIVAGSFRNIAGTVTAIDPAQKTLTVTDLSTKKPVTLKLTAETQMRKLPLQMAQRLAGRTGSEGASSAAGGGQGAGGSRSSAGMAAPGGASGGALGGTPDASSGAPPSGAPSRQRPGMDAGNSRPGNGMGAGESAGGPGAGESRPRSADPAAMLARAPVVTLAELKKGDAVMIVATEAGGGAADAATAITLIAGVEPLLEKSSGAASQNLFSASWNLNGGGSEAQQ